jgi:hypothetical protein
VYILEREITGKFVRSMKIWANFAGIALLLVSVCQDATCAGPRQRTRGKCGKFTDEEILLLTALIAADGRPKPKWTAIAAQMPGRTARLCREYCQALVLGPSQGAWTPQEDDILLTHYQHLAPNWTAMCRVLPGRSSSSIRDRYRRLKEKQQQQGVVWPRLEDVDPMDSFLGDDSFQSNKPLPSWDVFGD